jgi:hypothetical protein
MSETFSIRQPWECPRCHRINGPHVDHCDCKPEQKQAEPQRIVIQPVRIDNPNAIPDVWRFPYDPNNPPYRVTY